MLSMANSMKFIIIFSILLVATYGFSTIPDAFAEPIKIKHESGSEIWQYNSTHQVYRSAPTHIFNNATIYLDGTNTWVTHDLDILGGGDYDILSGMIATKFIGSTITHYDPKTGLDAGTEKLHLMKNNGSTEIPLTFVSRTHTTGIINENYNIRDIPVTDTRETITITELWTSSEVNITIDYFFDEGEPMKHTFTVTKTISGTETYQLYHEFDIKLEEVEMKSNSGFNLGEPDSVIELELEIKQGDIKFKQEFVNGTTSETLPHPTTLVIDKTTFSEILRVIEFKDLTGNLILGEIIAPSITDPAWNDFQELFIDATGDPKFFFRYGNWTISQSQSFQLDPDTYSSADPTEDGEILTNAQTGTSCSTTALSRGNTDGLMALILQDSDNSSSCVFPYVEWDITSIDDGADVTDTHFKYDIDSVFSPNTCDYNDIATQPSVASDQTLLDDIHEYYSFH